MDKNRNIDHIFEEGLTNFSEAPPAYVWDAIGSSVQGAKKDRKILIIWRSLAAAAFIGLIFLGGVFWNKLSEPNTFAESNTLKPKEATLDINENTIAQQNNITPPEENKSHKIILSENKTVINTVDKKKLILVADNKKHAYSTHKENNNIAITHPKKSTYSEKKTNVNNLSPIGKRELASNNIEVPKKLETKVNIALINYPEVNATQLFNYKNNTIIHNNAVNKLFYAYEKNIPKTKNEKKALQFALGGQFSPSYSYRETSTGNSSSVAAKEGGIMSYTGGINLNIKTKKKWGIETGIYYAQVGQKFSNPLVGGRENMLYNSASTAGIESKTANLQNSLGDIKIENTAQQGLMQEIATSTSKVHLNADINTYKSQNELQTITIQQELGYIEIPFLLRYELVDKSFGLSISGGMSTNLLIGNNAYKIDDNSKNRIGEMENINNINYSAILGFGLRTPIFKTLDLNLEPRVRYFINSVTESGASYKPYSIGIYTGISYKF